LEVVLSTIPDDKGKNRATRNNAEEDDVHDLVEETAACLKGK
jgi:hypothetical protein